MGDEEKEVWLDYFNELLDKQEEWKYESGWHDWRDDIQTITLDGSSSSDLNPPTIVFDTGHGDEMLKVTEDGFYVRGVKVEQGPGEAEAVYRAFKEFMTWAIISKPQAEE